MRHEAIIDGIMAKATRGNALTEYEKERNARIVRMRRIVGGWKWWDRWAKTRLPGLVGNHLGVALTMMAWNMKKWVMLK
jgi:IS5 family transposase